MKTAPLSAHELRAEIENFYARYAAAIDRKQANEWVAMFLEAGVYAVTTHNNQSTGGMWWYTDRGLAALKERAAFTHGYLWHQLQKTLHVISNVRAEESESGDIRSEAYFVMYSADRDGLSRLHVCGEYRDLLAVVDGAFRFREHRVIIDSTTVPPNMGALL